MKTSITRYSVVLVLLLQWVAVAMVIRISGGAEKIFADFNVRLPVITVMALNLTQPLLLAPVAAATTLIIVAVEVLLKSTAARFVIQVVDLSLWMVFAGFCLIAIQIPLLNLIAKLSH
jgi:hypothetical protein